MKKISLKTIQDALNRDEMRTISGGCGSMCSQSISCSMDLDCPGSCTCTAYNNTACQ